MLSTSCKHKAKGTGQLVGGWGMDFPARWANRAAQTAGGESSESPEHIPALLPPGARRRSSLPGCPGSCDEGCVIWRHSHLTLCTWPAPGGAASELGRKCQHIPSELEKQNKMGGKKSSAFPLVPEGEGKPPGSAGHISQEGKENHLAVLGTSAKRERKHLAVLGKRKPPGSGGHISQEGKENHGPVLGTSARKGEDTLWSLTLFWSPAPSQPAALAG